VKFWASQLPCWPLGATYVFRCWSPGSAQRQLARQVSARWYDRWFLSALPGLHMKLVTGRWMFFFMFKWGGIFPQVGAEHSCFNALSMHPFRHWMSLAVFFWVSHGLTEKSPIRWIRRRLANVCALSVGCFPAGRRSVSIKTGGPVDGVDGGNGSSARRHLFAQVGWVTCL